MTSFRTLITSYPGLTEELPLIHTSRCEFLSSIATTHALEPQPCGVFHESLDLFVLWETGVSFASWQ